MRRIRSSLSDIRRFAGNEVERDIEELGKAGAPPDIDGAPAQCGPLLRSLLDEVKLAEPAWVVRVRACHERIRPDAHTPLLPRSVPSVEVRRPDCTYLRAPRKHLEIRPWNGDLQAPPFVRIL